MNNGNLHIGLVLLNTDRLSTWRNYCWNHGCLTITALSRIMCGHLCRKFTDPSSWLVVVAVVCSGQYHAAIGIFTLLIGL